MSAAPLLPVAFDQKHRELGGDGDHDRARQGTQHADLDPDEVHEERSQGDGGHDRQHDENGFACTAEAYQ